MPLFTEDTPCWAATLSACEPSRMEVACKPEHTHPVVQEFGNREVYPGTIIPCSARWLHISLNLYDRMSRTSIYVCI